MMLTGNNNLDWDVVQYWKKKNIPYKFYHALLLLKCRFAFVVSILCNLSFSEIFTKNTLPWSKVSSNDLLSAVCQIVYILKQPSSPITSRLLGPEV